MTKLKIPKGFIHHDGGECPVEPDALVECLCRTIDGFGSAGVTRARYHEWDASKHEGGYGAVVAYRLADNYSPAIHPHERAASPGKLKAD